MTHDEFAELLAVKRRAEDEVVQCAMVWGLSRGESHEARGLVELASACEALTSARQAIIDSRDVDLAVSQ